MSADVHYGLEQARNNLPSIVEEARAGKRSIITRHGKPCAAVVPLNEVAKSTNKSGSSILSLRGTGKGLWGKNSSKTLADLRDEWPDRGGVR